MQTEKQKIYAPINLAEKSALLTEHWQPRVIAELNDYQFKIAKIEGDFIWHDHPQTDEAFIVIEGELRIDFRDGSVLIKPGEMYVVPKGVRHNPVAEEECQVLLVERKSTLHMGTTETEKTRSLTEQLRPI